MCSRNGCGELEASLLRRRDLARRMVGGVQEGATDTVLIARSPKPPARRLGPIRNDISALARRSGAIFLTTRANCVPAEANWAGLFRIGAGNTRYEPPYWPSSPPEARGGVSARPG